jgi:CDP-diacylglycerol--glycerol-3-phosphate 3-phosphatidyltransferase
MSKTTPIEWSNTPSHSGLYGQWWVAALGGVLSLGISVTLIGISIGWQNAARWAILPILGMAYIFAYLRRHLNDNFGVEGVLLPTLGWGNALTVTRAILLALLAGFLLLPRPTGLVAWVPGVLYTLAVLADFFDGYVARITRHTTRLGELLDMEFDGWGMLLASLLAVKYGQAPGWYLLVGLARYLYVAGLALRTRLGLVNHALPSNIIRRLFAGLQMGLTFVLLWPLFAPPGTHWTAAFFSLPFLLGFAKDWLLTCGWLKPGFGDRWEKAASWLLLWLPVGLRVAVVGLGLLMLPWVPWPFGVWMFGLMGVLWGGIAPRVASVMGLLMLGFLPVNAFTIGLLALYCGILYMGGGKLTMWTPEERFIQRRAGETA